MTGGSSTYYGSFTDDRADYTEYINSHEEIIFEDFIKDYDNVPIYKSPLKLDSILFFKITPRARSRC